MQGGVGVCGCTRQQHRPAQNSTAQHKGNRGNYRWTESLASVVAENSQRQQFKISVRI